MVRHSVTDRVGLHIICYLLFVIATTLAHYGKLDFFPHLLADVSNIVYPFIISRTELLNKIQTDLDASHCD